MRSALFLGLAMGLTFSAPGFADEKSKEEKAREEKANETKANETKAKDELK